MYPAVPDEPGATDRIMPTQPIGADQKKITAPTGFQPFMQQTAGTSPTQGAPSPFDLSQGQVLAGKPSVETLMGQVTSAQQTMGDLSTKLNTPNLKLNRAQRYLVGNKLSDAKAHIRSAAGKLGVEETPPSAIPTGTGPVAKFLGILSDGQYQLDSAKQQLEQMKSDGKSMNAGELLLMQVKLNKAQVEIEYASVLLSKAVDAMKQLFQIQL